MLTLLYHNVAKKELEQVEELRFIFTSPTFVKDKSKKEKREFYIPKLNDNCQTFRANYKNNPVAADRLRYDILFHSDLSRDRGQSNGLDLEHFNWGNYDLVVIDESHNFCNGGNIDRKNLLQEAINSIVSIKEESDIDSLFSLGETTALRGEIKGLDDFELITFLVIRKA